MTTNTLDSALADSLAAAERGALPVTASQHDRIVGRVRNRRRRAHAARGTLVVAGGAALALASVGITTALSRNQHYEAPAGPATSTSSDSLITDPAPGSPVTLAVFVVDALDQGALSGGPRIDSSALVHISADRTRVELISLSSFGNLTAPECDADRAPDTVTLESVFATVATDNTIADASSCTAIAISHSTGVAIDGTITVSFSEFADIVDQLGGVSVCNAEPIAAPRAKLYLPKGNVTLTGDQALAYSRARSGTGLGGNSDNQRTDRSAVEFAAIARAMATAHATIPATAVTTGAAADPQFLASLDAALSDLDPANVIALSAPLDLSTQTWDTQATDDFGALENDEPGTPLGDGC